MPLTARVSAPARRIIKEAFLDLEKVISTEDRAELKDTTLEDVRKAAYQIEDQLAARQSLRNMRRLMPLFSGLEYYSKSIEILCNGTPYLAWIWSPLKLIMKIASGYIEAFEKLIKAYSQIGESLQRIQIINHAFSQNPDIQQTLAIFYTDILNFHKHAYQFVRRSGWKIFFMTSWGRFQRRFYGIIEDLKVHEDLIDKTVNAVHISEAQEFRTRLNESRQESIDKMKAEESEHTAQQFSAVVGILKIDESEQLEIFDSVISQASGASDWILKQTKIRGWIQCQRDLTFLFLAGHPGSGKSVLSTQIANFLKNSGNTSIVITHLCTYQSETSRTFDHILRSLLTQLIRGDTDMIAYVYNQLILKKQVASSRYLKQLLCELMEFASSSPSRMRYIHLILDGLDECDQEDQTKVIGTLEKIITAADSSGSTVCKVLVSTRMTLRKSRNKHTLSLSEEKHNINRGITHYVNGRLTALHSKMSRLRINKPEMKDMEERIVTKADGMFLWARLVLDYLAHNIFYNKSEMLSAVDRLPRKLQDFYERILTQLIANFDYRSTQRMKSVLGWIAFSKRPLHLAEIRSALAFSEGNPHIDELPPQDLFDMCAPLITKRRDSTFMFIHISVKEYLQSDRSRIYLDPGEVMVEHGVAIMTCLLSGAHFLSHSYPDPARRLLRVLYGIHGLHIYATEHWAEYILSAMENTQACSETRLLDFGKKLAAALCGSNTDSQPADLDGDYSDKVRFRLAALRAKHLPLFSLVENFMRKNSQKYLTSSTQQAQNDRRLTPSSTSFVRGDSIDLLDITDIHSLLINYQRTIERILLLRNFTGISLQELEQFKHEFRTSAFTCRFRPCHHAEHGFDSASLLQAHEATHRGIFCPAPGCQYPPFTSESALKKHRLQYHNEGTPAASRKTIRKNHDINRATTSPLSPQRQSRDQGNQQGMQGKRPQAAPSPSSARPVMSLERLDSGATNDDEEAQRNLAQPLWTKSGAASVNFFQLAPEQLENMARQGELDTSGNAQMNQNQVQQPPSHTGQMGPNIGQQGSQGMPQVNEIASQPPMRSPQPNSETQLMMDMMDLPPQVISEIASLPVEVKKWKDLKVWLHQKNNIPPQVRSQLAMLQSRQFQILIQKRAQLQQQAQQGQNPNMTPSMPSTENQTPNQQQDLQRLPAAPPQPPPENISVSHAELAQLRSLQPRFASMPDDRLRQVLNKMKREAWQQQQQQHQQRAIRLRTLQGQPIGQPVGQQVGPNGLQLSQLPMQPQPKKQQPAPTPSLAQLVEDFMQSDTNNTNENKNSNSNPQQKPAQQS